MTGDPRVVGDETQLGRAFGELVEHAVETAPSESSIEILADGDGIQIAYESETLPAGDELSLTLAESIARLHGGGLAVEARDGVVTLALSYAFRPAVQPVRAA